jgi:hypothetical protein
MSSPKVSLAQAKIESVKRFILQHPAAKDFEIIDALRCSRRTIAYARADLVQMGLIPAPRKRVPKSEPALVAPVQPISGSSVPEGTVVSSAAEDTYAGSIVTPATVMMLASGPVDDPEETDLEIQKRMTREAKKMAFDPKLHPDTRMSAMQLWVKLKDAARARDLGPGVPKTYEDAVTRCMDMFRACGIKMVLDAFQRLWGLNLIIEAIENFLKKEPADEVQPEAVEQADAPSPSPESAGAPVNNTDVPSDPRGDSSAG